MDTFGTQLDAHDTDTISTQHEAYDTDTIGTQHEAYDTDKVGAKNGTYDTDTQNGARDTDTFGTRHEAHDMNIFGTQHGARDTDPFGTKMVHVYYRFVRICQTEDSQLRLLTTFRRQKTFIKMFGRPLCYGPLSSFYAYIHFLIQSCDIFCVSTSLLMTFKSKPLFFPNIFMALFLLWKYAFLMSNIGSLKISYS